MEIKDVVLKLIGGTQSKGCSSRDKEVLKNVEVLGELVIDLFNELTFIARDRHSYESSVKEIGNKAMFFINEIKEGCNYEE